jgi:phosphoethanolamine N-methyltransferase
VAGTEFLDTRQYSEGGIRDYEQVWGEGFVSPGGPEKARELIARLELEPGARVLDACCGLGGSAFLMAREFGFWVDGVDLSSNMVRLAQASCCSQELQDRVAIRLGDCLELEGEEVYDAIFSRDAFLHIQDKARLFSTLHRLLKPGGKLLFTDYACAPQPWSDGFAQYVASRGYTLHTLDEYQALVSAAGFVEVEGVDSTEEFAGFLRDDLETIARRGLRSLEASFQAKLGRALEGEQRTCLITARRAPVG